jgi:hypothetical protein
VEDGTRPCPCAAHENEVGRNHACQLVIHIYRRRGSYLHNHSGGDVYRCQHRRGYPDLRRSLRQVWQLSPEGDFESGDTRRVRCKFLRGSLAASLARKGSLMAVPEVPACPHARNRGAAFSFF